MNVVYNCDCMEFMAKCKDNEFELAIVDPPYGIKDWNSRGINKKCFAGNESIKLKEWDIKPNKEYFNELFRISKNQIIWGANHFIEFLYNTKSTIIWDKNNVGMHFNNYELAWTNNINEANRIFRMSIAEIIEDKIHSCQKPVALYRWLLQNYAKPNDKIFDSHVGSGSSRIACYELGFNFTGCELDVDYWQAQEERFKLEKAKINGEFYLPEENNLFKGV